MTREIGRTGEMRDGPGARRLPLLALLVAAAVPGCGAAPFELTLSAFERQRAKWEAIGLTSYSFAYRERCYCGSSALLQGQIEVRDGQVVAVSATGQPPGTEAVGSFPTIDDLFDRIEAAIRDEAAALSVSYDPELGYPREIIIDFDYGTDDDEVTIDATDLVAL